MKMKVALTSSERPADVSGVSSLSFKLVSKLCVSYYLCVATRTYLTSSTIQQRFLPKRVSNRAHSIIL